MLSLHVQSLQRRQGWPRELALAGVQVSTVDASQVRHLSGALALDHGLAHMGYETGQLTALGSCRQSRWKRSREYFCLPVKDLKLSCR